MTKGAIYYTDHRPKKFILDTCREQIKKACPHKIVSVSLHHPIDLGENIVIKDRERSYPTMLFQIVLALEKLDTDYVFFLEHDVLYHPSHFDFTPPKDDIYYYNLNNYRWGIKEDFAITYSGLHSLSQMCANRKTALEHFKGRLKYVEDKGWDKQRSREPRWGRQLGYEPGTKKKRRGGFSNEDFEVWYSEHPNIDIRHRHCFSSPKYMLEDFKHPPTDWKEKKIEDFKPVWDLKPIYDYWQSNHLIN